MRSDLVVMDNAIINSAYSLSLNEQRLVLSAIAKIPKGVAVDGDTVYCVGREDFLKLGVDSYTVAREIRTATKDLMKKSLVVKTPLGEYEYQWLQAVFRFDREAEIKLREKFPNSGDLEAYMKGAKKLNFLEAIKKKADDDDIVACLVFSQDVAIHLTDLKKNFTQFELEDLAGFGSTYSVRIYQLIMQFKSTGYRKITINDLRYTLALGNKYPLVADLKRWVIDTAIAEINEKSPYKVSYEMIKTGRKFTHLALRFQKKQPALTAIKDVQRDPNTIDCINGQTDNDAKKHQSWETKGLSDAQIKKIACNVREFVDANSGKISVNERRGYDDVFEDWKPLLRDPKTVSTFNMIQKLLERSPS